MQYSNLQNNYILNYSFTYTVLPQLCIVDIPPSIVEYSTVNLVHSNPT